MGISLSHIMLKQNYASAYSYIYILTWIQKKDDRIIISKSKSTILKNNGAAFVLIESGDQNTNNRNLCENIYKLVPRTMTSILDIQATLYAYKVTVYTYPTSIKWNSMFCLYVIYFYAEQYTKNGSSGLQYNVLTWIFSLVLYAEMRRNQNGQKSNFNSRFTAIS